MFPWCSFNINSRNLIRVKFRVIKLKLQLSYLGPIVPKSADSFSTDNSNDSLASCQIKIFPAKIRRSVALYWVFISLLHFNTEYTFAENAYNKWLTRLLSLLTMYRNLIKIKNHKIEHFWIKLSSRLIISNRTYDPQDHLNLP